MPILNQPPLLSEHASLQIVLNFHKNNKLLRSMYLDYLMTGFIEEGYTQLCLEEAEYTLQQEIEGSYLFFNPRRLKFITINT